MALPISKEYLLTQLRNFKSIVLDPAYIIQKQTLPLATAQNLGVIFQYTGNDAVNYTIGGFYQVQVVPETEPAEYAWVEVSTKTLIDNTTVQRNANKELYIPAATDTTLGVVQAGDGIDVDSDGVISVVARLEEIAELPQATSALEGKIYLLTATQTGYDRGGIYMCEESTETAGTYEWKLISMSPLKAGKGITIEDDVISADTNIFHGTLDEWDALTPAEQAEYDFIATPDEAVEDIADAIIDGDMRAVTSNAVADAIDELHNNLYTLISSVALTTTATEYTLILNRKLSDYDYIIVQQYDSISMRNSAVIHLNQFKNKRVILSTLHGANSSSAGDYSVSGINVSYVDDTTISAYATGSALVNTMEIIGAKITT